MITDIRANLEAARNRRETTMSGSAVKAAVFPDKASGGRQEGQRLDLDTIAAEAKQQQAAGLASAVKAALDALNVAEDQHGDVVVTVKLGQRFDTFSLVSGRGHDLIARTILDATNKMPGKETVTREAGRLRLMAMEAGRKCRTHIRVADISGGYAIDMGDAAGQYMEILPGQITIKANDGSLRFKRGKGYGTLPTPILGTLVDEALGRMRAEVISWGCPVSKQDMLIAALLESWRPDTPYPIMMFIGSAGRGKTTAVRCASRCIDPSPSGMPPEVPLEAKEIIAAAANAHVITADNKGKLDAEQQNLVCQIATGAELTQRVFYFQTETLRVAIAKPLMITAIQHVLTAPDAVDRAVTIEVNAPKNYVPVAEIMAAFDVRLPQIVGDLGLLLAAVLKTLPAVVAQRTWKHRLVEFAQTGEAMVQASGEPAGSFTDALEAVRRTAARDYAEGDGFLKKLLALLHAKGTAAPKGGTLPAARNWREKPGWAAVDTGTGALYAARPGVILNELRGGFGDALPKSERELSGALTRVAPTLSAMGIQMQERMVGTRKVFAFGFELNAVELS